MTNETPVTDPADGPPTGSKRAASARPIGSLREALIAAGRDDARVTQITERSTSASPRVETAVRTPPVVEAPVAEHQVPPPLPQPVRAEALQPSEPPRAEAPRTIVAKLAPRPSHHH